MLGDDPDLADLTDLTEADLAALQLAVDLTLADDPPDPGRTEQVMDFLQGYGNEHFTVPPRPWREVAEFCSYHQQTTRLDLLLATSPPCCILTVEQADAILRKGPRPGRVSGADNSDCSSARLLKRMLRYGVSPYHPDPLRAIADAKKAKPKPTSTPDRFA